MRKSRVREINRIALAAAFIAVCSWLTVPMAVPYTMQSFAVFTVAALLGGKDSFFAVLVYIILGAIGVPVFSGMRGGFGVLFGETGGYLLGFLLGSAVCGALCRKKKSIAATFGAMLLCLIMCYTVGCIWASVLYLGKSESAGLMFILGRFVLPFVIPDIIKIALAVFTVKALERRRAI